MTTKIKTTLLTGLFFFGLLTGLKAQDKYEYVIVRLTSYSGGEIIVATKEKTEKFSIDRNDGLYTSLIKKVSELNSQGWEVYNSTETAVNSSAWTITYFLKKRKD